VLNMQVNIYPNPVTRSSIVEYDLPESGTINVSVMSMTGQQLATLYNGFKPRGVQRLGLSSNSVTMSKLSAGSYLLRVTVNGKSKVQQFVVSP
jgi:hypothetical protein